MARAKRRKYTVEEEAKAELNKLAIQDTPQQPATPALQAPDSDDDDDYNDNAGTVDSEDSEYEVPACFDSDDSDDSNNYDDHVGEADPEDPEYEAAAVDPEDFKHKVPAYFDNKPNDAEGGAEGDAAGDDAVICEKGNRTRNSQGYLRVAKRVAPSHPVHATWVPGALYRARLRDRVRKELSRECRKYLGTAGTSLAADKDTFGRFTSETYQHLLSSFEKVGDEDKLSRFCDWTGLKLRFDSGLFTASLEAALNCAPLIVDGDRKMLANHTPNNLFMVFSALNFTKRNLPPVVLPLLGAWLRILNDKREFKTKEPELRWVFNALMNCCTMHYLVGTSNPDRGKRLSQLEELTKNDDRCLEQLLNMLRTGEWSGLLERKLSELRKRYPDTFLFHMFAISPSRKPRRKIRSFKHSNIYSTMLHIAVEYNISQADFEKYLTIPSINYHEKRVFYPFHAWTIPLVEEIWWDSDTTSEWAELRVKELEKCDRNARELGVNEENLTPDRLLLEVVHKKCCKLQELINKRPSLSSEEIKFRSGLDAVGYPLIPLILHVTKATIGKYPQHGIAMETGYRGAPVDNFDPVSSWNKTHSTMDFATAAANHAQGQYDFDVLPDIRAVLQSIPFDGPLAAPCRTMGDEIWGIDLGPQDVRCPEPMFAGSPLLLPIGPWIEGSSHNLTCPECGEPQASVGALVHHGYNHHLREPFVCQECPEKFPSEETRRFHTEYEHPKNAREYNTKVNKHWDDLICPFEDCNKPFAWKSRLNQHILEVHEEERPHVCGLCLKTFAWKSYLNQHILEVHEKERPHVCGLCLKTFARKSRLNQHILEVHEEERPHVCGLCLKTFARKSQLNQHILEVHEKERPHVCGLCLKTFARKSQLNRHIGTQHKEQTNPPRVNETRPASPPEIDTRGDLTQGTSGPPTGKKAAEQVAAWKSVLPGYTAVDKTGKQKNGGSKRKREKE
ncbi:hypothetical protein F5Y01DRAFT_321768 [Xylaria sp. FL0043]|nr:hypothetical protein F5Y01DRAFT_321768 [Xylaria sp. FL0043]